MQVRPADDLGPVLAGRGVASELRERVEAELRTGGTVIIDFEGVEAMSPSFADELFAKLEASPQDRVQFENLREDLRALVRYVRQGRSNGE